MSTKTAFEIKEIIARDVTNTYQDFGIPTENPCIVACFINSSDVEMYISMDGVKDIIRLPAGGTTSLDTKNCEAVLDSGKYIFGKKIQLQIKLQNPLAPAKWGDVFVNLVTIQLP